MRALILLTLLVLAAPAQAQFIGLLKNSPAELFDDADLHLFLDTAKQALDEGKLDEALAWQNPKTGHKGDMTVVKRFRARGHECTLLRVRNEAQGRKSNMQHNLCSIDGRWRLVGDLRTGEPK